MTLSENWKALTTQLMKIHEGVIKGGDELNAAAASLSEVLNFFGPSA
jgi:hypothetical protein